MNSQINHSTNPFFAKKAQQNAFVYHLDRVSVKFGNVNALNNISFTITPGEIIFVTGKSGAGKSTLLNILAEDVRVTSGKLLAPMGRNSFAAQVFQDLKLLEDCTCEENLSLSYDPSLYKNKSEFYADMTELSNVLDIKKFFKTKVKDINGGSKQKVALVRALLSKPNVLLADEPTASLDKESATKLFEVLNFYNVKRGMTVIWASHNRDLVKQFPGKILHLENGKLIYSGHACFI